MLLAVPEGYVCFPGVGIAGNIVGSDFVVPSRDQCVRNCEARSELCSLAIYTPSQVCVYMIDPFLGQFDRTGLSPVKTACLRAQSGGETLRGLEEVM